MCEGTWILNRHWNNHRTVKATKNLPINKKFITQKRINVLVNLEVSEIVNSGVNNKKQDLSNPLMHYGIFRRHRCPFKHIPAGSFSNLTEYSKNYHPHPFHMRKSYKPVVAALQSEVPISDKTTNRLVMHWDSLQIWHEISRKQSVQHLHFDRKVAFEKLK